MTFGAGCTGTAGFVARLDAVPAEAMVGEPIGSSDLDIRSEQIEYSRLVACVDQHLAKEPAPAFPQADIRQLKSAHHGIEEL